MSIYDEWLEAANQLKIAKAVELKLRKKICEKILGDKIEGAVTELAHYKRFKVTATAKLNRSIDRSVLEAIWEDLTDDEKECVDYKPSLKLAEYKKIEQTGGKLLDAVTVKPGTPTLKVLENFE